MLIPLVWWGEVFSKTICVISLPAILRYIIWILVPAICIASLLWWQFESASNSQFITSINNIIVGGCVCFVYFRPITRSSLVQEFWLRADTLLSDICVINEDSFIHKGIFLMILSVFIVLLFAGYLVIQKGMILLLSLMASCWFYFDYDLTVHYEHLSPAMKESGYRILWIPFLVIDSVATLPILAVHSCQSLILHALLARLIHSATLANLKDTLHHLCRYGKLVEMHNEFIRWPLTMLFLGQALDIMTSLYALGSGEETISTWWFGYLLSQITVLAIIIMPIAIVNDMIDDILPIITARTAMEEGDSLPIERFLTLARHLELRSKLFYVPINPTTASTLLGGLVTAGSFIFHRMSQNF